MKTTLAQIAEKFGLHPTTSGTFRGANPIDSSDAVLPFFLATETITLNIDTREGDTHHIGLERGAGYDEFLDRHYTAQQIAQAAGVDVWTIEGFTPAEDSLIARAIREAADAYGDQDAAERAEIERDQQQQREALTSAMKEILGIDIDPTKIALDMPKVDRDARAERSQINGDALAKPMINVEGIVFSRRSMNPAGRLSAARTCPSCGKPIWTPIASYADLGALLTDVERTCKECQKKIAEHNEIMFFAPQDSSKVLYAKAIRQINYGRADLSQVYATLFAAKVQAEQRNDQLNLLQQIEHRLLLLNVSAESMIDSMDNANEARAEDVIFEPRLSTLEQGKLYDYLQAIHDVYGPDFGYDEGSANAENITEEQRQRLDNTFQALKNAIAYHNSELPVTFVANQDFFNAAQEIWGLEDELDDPDAPESDRFNSRLAGHNPIDREIGGDFIIFADGTAYDPKLVKGYTYKEVLDALTATMRLPLVDRHAQATWLESNYEREIALIGRTF